MKAIVLYDGAAASTFRGLHRARNERLSQLVRIAAKKLSRIDERAFWLTHHFTATCTVAQQR